MPTELQVVDDALVRLRRLWSASHQQVLDHEGRPIDMSSVLVVEACARGAGSEVTVGDVARFADVEHSTASRLVDRAVRAGLVARTASGHDARRTSLTLTPAGREARERAVAFRLSWLQGILSGWSPEDVTAFGRLLGRFAEAVVTHGGPGRSAPGGP